jgi:riboflavin kinase/FMN adenylyltransferase
MAIVRLNWEKKPPEVACKGVISIGNFDGVHRGHGALIEQSRQLAKEISSRVVAVTFDPHPLQLLAPDQFQPPLTTIDDRADYLLWEQMPFLRRFFIEDSKSKES